MLRALELEPMIAGKKTTAPRIDEDFLGDAVLKLSCCKKFLGCCRKAAGAVAHRNVKKL